MIGNKFIPEPYTSKVNEGEVSWQSPSNIALVKYWGKHGEQLPHNPSISFTLNKCHTKTNLVFKKLEKPNSEFKFDVFLEGRQSEDFKPKIEAFFSRTLPYLPFLKHYSFIINTENTFPHSSGIASSASGMSALALCLMSIEKQLNPNITDTFFKQKASFLARLGSGSACRSIEGPLVVWGEHKDIKGSHDDFGIKVPFKIHPVFNNYQDTILLVDEGKKQVSSTLGHQLMHGHPFASSRFKQAKNNITALKAIFETGNINTFVQLVESEALSLHAMMMTSRPYFILMHPNTLKIINAIWAYRKETGSQLCFTLDAGANVHVLYPEKEKEDVLKFIDNELIAFCHNSHYICDCIGFGAKSIPN